MKIIPLSEQITLKITIRYFFDFLQEKNNRQRPKFGNLLLGLTQDVNVFDNKFDTQLKNSKNKWGGTFL